MSSTLYTTRQQQRQEHPLSTVAGRATAAQPAQQSSQQRAATHSSSRRERQCLPKMTASEQRSINRVHQINFLLFSPLRRTMIMGSISLNADNERRPGPASIQVEPVEIWGDLDAYGQGYSVCTYRSSRITTCVVQYRYGSRFTTDRNIHSESLTAYTACDGSLNHPLLA